MSSTHPAPAPERQAERTAVLQCSAAANVRQVSNEIRNPRFTSGSLIARSASSSRDSAVLTVPANSSVAAVAAREGSLPGACSAESAAVSRRTDPRPVRATLARYSPAVHLSSESDGLMTIWSWVETPPRTLKRRSVVLPDVDRPQLHFLVGSDDGQPRSLRAEQHRIYRHRHFVDVGSNGEVNFAERSRQQATIFVWHIHFREQAFACWDRSTPPYVRPCAENLCPGNSCSVTVVDSPTLMNGSIGLRDAGIDAQRIDACDVEQFATRRTCARIDQCSRIHIAFRNHAGKWCVDFLEALKLFQSTNIRVRRRQIRLRLFVPAGSAGRLPARRPNRSCASSPSDRR